MIKFEDDNIKNLKALAWIVLTNAKNYQWSLQGFGLLRMHLPNDMRLHVWDSRYRFPEVSMIHDHLQWGLSSIIIAGKLTNRKYEISKKQTAFPYMYTTMKPGYGTYFKEDPKLVYLMPTEHELYKEGDSYCQRPEEIHETDAADGTVTLMKKYPTDDESARVFWPEGEEWGSAEPKSVDLDIVEDITSNALARWF